MVYIGGLITVLAIIAIIKKIEVRLVLFVAGVLMAILGGDILAAMDAFTETMIHGTMVPIICTVMGFSFVLKTTECDKHLINLIATPMTKLVKILIPATVFVTALLNIALPSAAGLSAAIGPIVIPALAVAGVHPVIAGSAILAGAFAGPLSPGNVVNAHLAEVADVNVMEVVAAGAPMIILCLVISAAALTIVAMVRGENKGYVPTEEDDFAQDKEFKVNILKAIVPFFPLLLLVITSPAIGISPHEFSVPEAMLLGIFIAFLVTLKDPQEISKSFFNGMGSAYTKIIGIVIGATVFTTGMEVIGLTGALIDLMENSETVVSLSAVLGPFALGAITGSRNAATLAFNGVVTPNAVMFGFDQLQLGTAAILSAALGATMSPVAGVTVICASLAKVNPIELPKRTYPGMIAAAVVVFISLTFF